MDLTEALYIVPCRSGSKRLPGKNWLPLGGKPLIRWTLDLLDGLGLRDRTVIVDDAQRPAAGAREFGRHYLERPSILATDTASSEDVVRFAIAALGVHPSTVVVLLQPTSPIRQPEHLACIVQDARNLLGSVVSGRNGGPNGAYYAATAAWWAGSHCIAGLYDERVCWRAVGDSIDIDTAEDLAAVEATLLQAAR